MSKKIAFITFLVAILLVAALSAAETLALSGDGSSTVSFYVESYGNASIYFCQNEGKCCELSYTHLIDGITGEEEEWGKYHIYMTAPDGRISCTNWDKTFNGEDFQLSLRSSGIYKIQFVPYTAQEMTDSWTLDKFLYWTKDPCWFIWSCSNCDCYDYNPASRIHTTGDVQIYCYDEQGSVIYSETRTITGSTSVCPPSLSNYRSISQNVYVSFDSSTGICNPSYINFYYSRVKVEPDPTPYICHLPPQATPEPAPSQQKVQSSGNPVPTRWDTYFKPATCHTANKNLNQNLDRLHDGKSSSVFFYTIWSSEWKKGYSLFTAYFNDATVSSIGLINGNPRNYYGNARIRKLRVKINTSGGSYETTISVPDINSGDYQIFSLGGTYTGVQSIEMEVTGTHDGKNNSKNNVCIADIRFY